MQRGKTLPMGSPVGRGWRSVMLKDGTQVAEQSMTCNTPLRLLLKLDGRSQKPSPINWLVTSSSCTYIIVPTLLANPKHFYHICDRRVEGLGVQGITLKSVWP